MPGLSNSLNRTEMTSSFSKLYGGEAQIIQRQQRRYRRLIEKFKQHFGDGKVHLFSTPGRTELAGNHTDHNAGRVLAASVDLDVIAAATKSSDGVITLISEGYPKPFCVALDDLRPRAAERRTTTALIRGIASRFKDLGYRIGGVQAFLTSDVLIGSGLSSSAAVEILIATLLNTLYNDARLPEKTLASIAHYAENVYFDKPCGLMDQLACATGGIICIDFADSENPDIRQINFDFEKHHCQLLVVDTGESHAGLSGEYSAIVHEMQAVAQALGKKTCREMAPQDILENMQRLRSKAGDRAVLRAWHFLAENERVAKQVQALENGDLPLFLRLVSESGSASLKWLQNGYAITHPRQQGISLALALTEDYLAKAGAGACRIHGGGFAGTIQVFLPTESVVEYTQFMESVFGEQSVQALRLRPVGTRLLNEQRS